MNIFRRILKPPIFEWDAEKTRRAEILHYGSILLFIFTLILFWINLVFGSQAEKSVNWTLGVITVAQFIVQWLIRTDKVNGASIILLTIGWLAITEMSRNIDGVRDVAILGYVLILLGSGYLLGWRAATVYTLTSIVAVWWLAHLQMKSVITPSLGNPYRTALDLTVIFILIFFIVYFLLNVMTKSLEKAQRELYERQRVEKTLESERERLQLALDAAHMGTWEWNIQTGAVSWSDDVARLFNLEPEQIEGQFENQYEMYLSLIHPDDISKIQENFQRVLSGDVLDFVIAFRAIWPGGEFHWLESRGKVYRDENKDPVHMAGTIVDITGRKHAEIEREHLIRELEAKNNELEQFSYTVSHDLKAPLITINGFLGYLEEDVAAGDLDRVNRDSQRIQEAVGKMRLLLDQLLELSRIGRMMNPPEEVSFEELAREALENVHGRLEEWDIAVSLSPNLPTVYGDRQRLVEVLQNLIDNAAKFMGEQPTPEIVIGLQGEENGLPVFFVKDNGIGIDPEHHELVFALFQRLNPKTDGTGIGLALVKRIIEFHGGRIWIESDAGKGSTFFFTLQTESDSKS